MIMCTFQQANDEHIILRDLDNLYCRWRVN